MDNSNAIDNGFLRVFVTTPDYFPIKNARIELANEGEPDQIIEVLNTDESGLSDTISLEAPPLEYSMEPSDNQPYSVYNIRVTAPDFDQQIVTGIQILPNETGIQNIVLNFNPESENVFNPIVIGGHTLWEFYPPKIAESEIKPLNESGEIVLRRVVVPETIVVHDGSPSDSSAPNYYVPYLDYIKKMLPNISSEIVEMQKTLQPGTCVAFGKAFKVPLIIRMELPNPEPHSSNCDVVNRWK